MKWVAGNLGIGNAKAGQISKVGVCVALFSAARSWGRGRIFWSTSGL